MDLCGMQIISNCHLYSKGGASRLFPQLYQAYERNTASEHSIRC